MQVLLLGEDNRGWQVVLEGDCSLWSIIIPASRLLTTAERHNNSTQIYTLLLVVLHLTMAHFVTPR